MPNKDKNIPKRRFKSFENADAWELRKLGELTSYRNGKGYEDNQSDFGKYELINLNSISIEGGLKPSGKFINYASETLNKNDLVMVLSDVGHGDLLGRVAIIPEDDRFVLNQRVALLRNNDYADYKYLFAYINANQHYFKLQGAGSSQLNLSKKAVENFVVHIPSQKEQSTIGTFFSTLDQHITLHQRKLDKLKSVKQAYLSEMFPAEGERVPKRRFPGFTDDWELRKLGELTSYRNGKGYEDNQSDFGKYELINLNSISIEGGLKPSGKFINYASETLNKNDLVMVLSDVGHGDLLGRVAIIPEDDRFVLNQRVALLRNNDYADYKYLFAYINANQHYFKLQGAGSSQLNLSKKAVENFVVHIPSQKEQSTIGTFFSTLDQHITLHQRKLEKLKNLKKALLNELFV
ncbi:restriction endonuclease subunit S [Streptococcus suis]|uniref:restriction endonuclease subunit S n=1 Tax=Streptococcus suis TaxID=1307 RepID=UPI003F8B536A